MKKLVFALVLFGGVFSLVINAMAEDLYYNFQGAQIQFSSQDTMLNSWLKRAKTKVAPAVKTKTDFSTLFSGSRKRAEVGYQRNQRQRKQNSSLRRYMTTSISRGHRRSNISRPLEDKKWNIIVSPHPDDGVLCCGAQIAEDRKNGERYKVIYITDGDAYKASNYSESKEYGARRRFESQAAMARLGVNKRDLIFLNFPDGSLSRLGSTFLSSVFTGQHQTNHRAYVAGQEYTEENLKKILVGLFDEFPPKQVYIPSQDDTHPDHRAAGQIVHDVLVAQKLTPEVLEYTVHGRSDLGTGNKINKWKRKLINLFASQFHDDYHTNYMYQLADMPEIFKK